MYYDEEMMHTSFAGNTVGEGGWFSNTDFMTRIMGFSFISSLLGGAGGGADGGNSALINSIRLLILGTIIEAGRRLFQYVTERFKPFQYSINAQFTEGDPAYDWLILFLTEEKVWSRSRQFRVSASSSLRKWTVNVNDANSKPADAANAEYVPTYDEAQLFRWRGYWAEIRRNKGTTYHPSMGNQVMTSMYLTIYTRDMSVLSALVEDARERYVKTSRPHVIVHSADQPAFGPSSTWNSAKRKQRRPLSSIILQEGVIQSLIDDAREFIRTEDWYTKAGIPHRRGYLLHGPPGTGKSSTIYAVAGELGLEIYSLSLSSGFVDDAFLQRAVAAIPKQAIFLIEDIDCAFPSREDGDDDDLSASSMLPYPPGMVMPGRGGRRRSPVTMSGLLNVLDGVGSEEGKLFFATTNYIDRLDPALLRPGRIDMKIQYKLATQAQAAALFLRFYPESYTTLLSEKGSDALPEKIPQKLTPAEKDDILAAMAKEFSSNVPEHEFSTAELQGYLLSCKQQPEKAVDGIVEWVLAEQTEREQKKQREEAREAKKREKKEAKEARELHGTLTRLGNMNIGPGAGVGGAAPAGPFSVPMMPPPNTVGGALGPGGFVGGLTLTPSPSTITHDHQPAMIKPHINGVSPLQLPEAHRPATAYIPFIPPPREERL